MSKKMRMTTSLLAAAMLGMNHSFYQDFSKEEIPEKDLDLEKPKKEKRPSLESLLSEDDSLKLSKMKEDRSSPGRKALKQFRSELSLKYRIS